MRDFLTGTGYTAAYIAICLLIVLPVRIFTRIQDEPFRKMLHCVALGSIMCYVYGFQIWYHAVFFCLFFAFAAYPILWFLECFPVCSRFFSERKQGELKSSLIVVFTMFSIVLTICWGLLNDKFPAVASVFAWGFGDAAAALVGKACGKHKIPGTPKSVEGTLSMFAVSAICVFIVMMIRGGISIPSCLMISVVTALVSATVELYTPGGYDTITCPLSAMAVILAMVAILK